MPEVSLISDSEQETMAIAGRFAKNLKAGDIVFLEGELGAGKTVFAKGIARAMEVSARKVNSPTFILMNVYQGKLPLYHFDLYRLENPEELKTVQFDEYFYGQGISLVEWPERLGGLSPKEHWLVALSHKSEHQRNICISYPSNPQRKFSL